MKFIISFFVIAIIAQSRFLKQASLSLKAEKVLEETIRENTTGDVIYFWARVDKDGVKGSNDVLTFWSMCDILNGGHCRHVISIICNIVMYGWFNDLTLILMCTCSSIVWKGCGHVRPVVCMYVCMKVNFPTVTVMAANGVLRTGFDRMV